jgi:hypothetical protein
MEIDENDYKNLMYNYYNILTFCEDDCVFSNLEMKKYFDVWHELNNKYGS